MRFSERLGITPVIPLQVGSMNNELRVSIWNLLLSVLSIEGDYGDWGHSLQHLAEKFFKFPTNEVPVEYPRRGEEWFETRYAELKWYEVYNLLEFISEDGEFLSRGRYNQSKVLRLSNEILERERSGYRFVNGQLAPITNETELKSIEDSLAAAKRAGLGGVFEHLQTSVQLLGKRPEPDFRNATKEAISAVESAAKCISGVENGGLDAALKKLASASNLHPALKDGFLKLYGYSSDEDGIRHAILEEARVGFDEAKFMLVACSAFVIFLVSKAEAAGLLMGDEPQK